jgi:diguanylate cyclase
VSASIYVLLWVLPIVVVSIAIGIYVGFGLALRRKAKQIHTERAKTLQALHALLQSTEELSTGVDAHNRDLVTVGRTVEDLQVAEDFEEIQSALIDQISEVIASNRRLEDDLVCTRYMLEQQAQELDRTRVESRTDGLSGVANRKSFEESLPYMLSSFKRKGDSFALVLLDVDHFKWINDTHGHQSGDRVVMILGKTLKALLRPRDYVARYGGDEFAIMLADVELTAAIKVAQRIRLEIARTNFDVGIDGARIAVTFSMGLAMATTEDDPESLLAKADKALYQSKNRGRNQLNWYEEETAVCVSAAGV